MNQGEALAELARRAVPTQPPTLTNADLLDCLDAARRPYGGYRPDRIRPWAAAANVAVGAVVTPTRRAASPGHFYVCTVAGATASVEPDWPLTLGGTVTDGGVTWKEAGLTYWLPAWDLNLAAALAWDAKANAAASMYAISDTGQSLARNQVYDHCVERARFYRGRRIGAIGSAAVTLVVSVYPNPGEDYTEP